MLVLFELFGISLVLIRKLETFKSLLLIIKTTQVRGDLSIMFDFFAMKLVNL